MPATPVRFLKQCVTGSVGAASAGKKSGRRMQKTESFI
jgi:hypothetical protein